MDNIFRQCAHFGACTPNVYFNKDAFKKDLLFRKNWMSSDLKNQVSLRMSILVIFKIWKLRKTLTPDSASFGNIP